MAASKMVLISRRITPALKEVLLKEAPKGWTVDVVNPDDPEAKVAKALADAEYLGTFSSGKISFKLLEPLKKLKIVQTAGQGTDHLPVKQLWEKGVYVCNSGGGNSLSVSELAILLMLATLRRLQPISASLKAGKWHGNSDMFNTHELYDKTVGIVGLGNIGKRVAHLAFAFGAKIIYHDVVDIPYGIEANYKARKCSLKELLKTADIVTLHVPSMEATRNLISAKELSLMKPTAYIINTSRGAVINEADLIKALKEKKIAGAGIDVWEPEPPDVKNPLLQMENVVATPHAGALAFENWRPRVQAMWNNIVAVSKKKEPLYQVKES